MEKYSDSKNNINAKTEILAEITTFMTVVYMIAWNSNILANFGRDGGQTL